MPIPSRPRRSALFVPAANERALAKVPGLDCDVVIVDLEDAVGPDDKPAARDNLARVLAAPRTVEMVVRINALSSPWGADDLAAVAALAPDAVLIPKVGRPDDVEAVARRLDPRRAPALWAMIETPAGVLDVARIAEAGRSGRVPLACLVVGTNDLTKETGVADPRYLMAWLMQIVLAAKAAGLDVLDGVSNDFRDLDRLEAQCQQSVAMGFDGKTLIHPSQIAAANRCFSPSAAQLAEAREIVALFEQPQNARRGVVSMQGRMVERLHLAQAQRLLARVRGTRES